MAGMVAALSGMLFSIQLDRYSRDEAERVAAKMTTGRLQKNAVRGR
jgi:hypothetical protein